jgi:predicted O-methyltransferase YrrM
MNYTYGRNIALMRTPGSVSAHVLNRIPGLIAVSNEIEPAYRDLSFTGPTCATWKEATILNLIVRHAKPNHVLEIGTAMGWTAAHMALALPEGGDLICVDSFQETARGMSDGRNGDLDVQFLLNMEACSVDAKVRLLSGESPAILASLPPEGAFDLVFIDGWKQDGQPLKDLEGVLPMTHAEPGHETIIVLQGVNHPDVQEAATCLTSLKTDKDVQQWYFTGFNTRNHLAMFMQSVYQVKGANKFPKWWDKFNDEISKVFRDAAE